MKKEGSGTMNRGKRSLITRPAGQGSSGRPIPLLTNHYKVSVKSQDETFYQYRVSIEAHDSKIINNKVIARKILDNLYLTYSSLLAGKKFAYDGESSLYTVGALPQNNFDLPVVLEDSFAEGGNPSEPGKRSRRSRPSNSFNVHLVLTATIPLRSVSLAQQQGAGLENLQDVLRVLDIILSQEAANRGCLLVRQSFFHDDSRNLIHLKGGVSACRGFHSSFRPTQGGLSLNIDVSTTMIVTPGPVIDHVKANLNVQDNRSIDWGKAKRILKHMVVKAVHTNWQLKIRGISEKPCNQLYFSFNKEKKGSGAYDDGQTIEITVYDYFTKHLNIDLTYSAYMPCLDVGKPKRPRYLPVELCYLVPLQRYKKSLSSLQRASLIENSRQMPQEKMRIVTDARKNHHYDDNPLLAACGISIEKQITEVVGRVLEAPLLKVGNGEDCLPRNGRWNYNNKKFYKPTQIKRWAIVNFSARCDTSYLSRELINCGRNKGILINQPHVLIEEEPHYRKASAATRVEKMFEQILAKLPPGPPPRTTPSPQLLLCVLPEKKICDIYGAWKKKCLCDFGFVNQCVAPVKINDQYLTNVLMKINSKLGGFNSLLATEHPSCIPLIKDTPTMILGMDVSHGPSGCSDIPSIAACWPLISRYGASVRSQSPKMEMIESLFEPQPYGSEPSDSGIMRELLLDFYNTSNFRKPSQIIVFRDGVSESQFSQVLDKEVEKMIQAYQHLDNSNYCPKFTVIVAQKNHHTKLFQVNGPANVPPGTVVDSGVVHPTNYDFYMCSQAGMIGTSRPAHYHVLVDEIGFSPDKLQSLVHSLSYVYQRSTSAVSIVAPVYYAHLAAKQMGQCLKSREDYASEDSSTEGGISVTSAQGVAVPKLPSLHGDLESTMFFC